MRRGLWILLKHLQPNCCIRSYNHPNAAKSSINSWTTNIKTQDCYLPLKVHFYLWCLTLPNMFWVNMILFKFNIVIVSLLYTAGWVHDTDDKTLEFKAGYGGAHL
jgi:hypothetical protein